MKKVLFKMRLSQDTNNQYENDLKKYDGQEAILNNEQSNDNGLLEIVFKDGSEYSVYKDEITVVNQ